MRPLLPVRLGPPCRRPILNATTSPLYARRYTRTTGLLLRLRNLLCASGDVLLLVCGFSLFLFLRRVLVRGFRRFVTHDPKSKVHHKRRQPTRWNVPLVVIIRATLIVPDPWGKNGRFRACHP